ncbi:MAG: 2-amino-4-oxopentanoate thiolase subunit OrtA [Bacillota bacterium]|nr:2-amino-4-oxopentanoate thiolase subunit OrtA [Bacillota bacterium]
MVIHKGQFVEISWVALEPSGRSESIPESTKQVPLVARVKGFAVETTEGAEEISIITLSDRVLRGKVCDDAPRHTHDFGKPQPELQRIGLTLRKELL